MDPQWLYTTEPLPQSRHQSVHYSLTLTPMSFCSQHGWVSGVSIGESLRSALSDHLQRSHLTSQWMPPALCSPARLAQVADRFVSDIRSSTSDDPTDKSSDDWSAMVSGDESPISIHSTSEANRLSIRMTFVRETGARTDEYVYYSPGLPFTF